METVAGVCGQSLSRGGLEGQDCGNLGMVSRIVVSSAGAGNVNEDLHCPGYLSNRCSDYRFGEEAWPPVSIVGAVRSSPYCQKKEKQRRHHSTIPLI